MDEDDDLFSFADRRAAAEAAKRDGMDRVDEHADKQWKIEMEAFAIEVAKRNPFFTSDDVYDLALKRGMTASTHDERAFGPVMMRLANANICRKANVAPVNSRRKSLHASPRAVWESLIFEA